MAKELPYFKFEPSEWLEGEIQVCSDESIVCFINLCSGYWLKLGNINYAFALHKYCKKNTSVLQELIDNKIITLNNDKINISFLDKQLNEFKEISEKRTSAANKRWENKEDNASVLQLQSKSNAIREDKIREEDIKENINKALPFKFFDSLINLGAEKQLVSDWIAVRKLKKLSNTLTAFNNFESEVVKSGKNINEVLKECVVNSWGGFKAEWINKSVQVASIKKRVIS
jgi:hypothetical protein